MDEIFGLPTIQLMWIVVAIAGVAAAVIAVIFIRRPILVRMGLRNIPRRRAQSVLVTMGLTIATIIVTVAFSTGDSLNSSIRSLALDGLQRIDHLITVEESGDDDDAIPDQVLTDLRNGFANDDRVEAVFGFRSEVVPIDHPETGQVEPLFFLVGVDAQEMDQIGDAILDQDGDALRLSSLSEDELIINQQAARDLDAVPGDVLRLFAGGALHRFTVAAIARDAVLSGQLTDLSAGGVIGLDTYEQLLGPNLAPPGEWAALAVVAAGGPEGALNVSESLDADIQSLLKSLEESQPALYQVNNLSRFGSDPIKSDIVDLAELAASALVLLFLFMGSFSVAAGILLIFLIFAMLAEERKPEMGIARAVGMQRNDLIQMFISEGMVYNLGAAIVGVVLGILFAIAMIFLLNRGFESLGFQFTWTITLKSIVISAGIGVVITFITVVFSSFRAARLNIVAAIRDIPESQYEQVHPLTPWRVFRNVIGLFTTAIGLALVVTTPLTLILGAPVAIALYAIGSPRARRAIPWVLLLGWRVLRWNPQWWSLFVVGGLLLLDRGLGSESFFLYMAGVSLVPLGVVMGLNKLRISGRRIPSRLLYTLGAAFVLFLWFAPNDWHERAFSSNLDGGPELFVLAGAMLTASGTMMLVFNLDLIVGILRLTGRRAGRLAPVLRIAASYPAAARYRTGMTIAMITLISFALVNFATINASFNRAFSSADSTGGFEVLAFNTDVSSVPDVRSALESAGADDVLADIEFAGRVEVGPLRGTRALTVETEAWNTIEERLALDANGDAQAIKTDPASVPPDEREAVVVGGADLEFLQGQEIRLQAISLRYEDEQAVWDAVSEGQPVALATIDAISGQFGFAGSEIDAWGAPDSISDEATRLPRILVELGLGDNQTQVEIIAILERVTGTFLDLDGEEGNLPTLLLPLDLAQELLPATSETRHYISIAAGADSLDVAQGLERELRLYSVDIRGELEQQSRTTSSILDLFQAFIGIGLLAGLAALGVIALRAVVERRQQIGVLRAIGFQSRLVGYELMLEMAFIAVLGLGLGTALALGLAWRLFAEGTFGEVSMYIPLSTVLPILFGSLLASLILTYFPARQAARTTIAEALRYE